MKIEERELDRVWQVGGGELGGAFREHGLITEYIVSVIPVILGAGVPLFAGKGSLERLKLVDSRSYPNGIVQLRYLAGRRAPHPGPVPAAGERETIDAGINQAIC